MTACPHCGSTYRHGEMIACCSGCGQIFYGQAAFDRHRDWSAGEGSCLDPATTTFPPLRAWDGLPHPRAGEPVFRPSRKSGLNEDGVVWSLTRTAEQEAAHRGWLDRVE